MEQSALLLSRKGTKERRHVVKGKAKVKKEKVKKEKVKKEKKVSKGTRPPVREGTKTAKSLDVLARENGATLEEIMKASGWDRSQSSSAISFFRANLGYRIDRDEESKRYKLVGKLTPHRQVEKKKKS